MVKLFANIGDPDHTPRSSASDLGLHCLPITLLGVSRLQWVNLFMPSGLLYLSLTPRSSAQVHFQPKSVKVVFITCISLLYRNVCI